MLNAFTSMLFCDGYASIGAINSVLLSECFLLLQACLHCSKIIFERALIFKVLQDIFERLEVWRCFFAYGYAFIGVID